MCEVLSWFCVWWLSLVCKRGHIQSRNLCSLYLIHVSHHIYSPLSSLFIPETFHHILIHRFQSLLTNSKVIKLPLK